MPDAEIPVYVEDQMKRKSGCLFVAVVCLLMLVVGEGRAQLTCEPNAVTTVQSLAAVCGGNDTYLLTVEDLWTGYQLYNCGVATQISKCGGAYWLCCSTLFNLCSDCSSLIWIPIGNETYHPRAPQPHWAGNYLWWDTYYVEVMYTPCDPCGTTESTRNIVSGSAGNAYIDCCG